ncbi:MAG: hypothetical protein Q4E35_08865 [Eubacteriales bacterium]|nr:hypothetical protein [Eubacteriales bacterium]
MKMQSTEMEFVTFDAQDVIATSGGLTAKFTVSGALYTGPNGAEEFEYKNNGTWGWEPVAYQFLLINTGKPDNGKTYILREGVSYYEGNVATNINESGSLGLFNVTEGTTADETLDSLAGIVEWLGKYGAGAQ